jgi:hypothetical protein
VESITHTFTAAAVALVLWFACYGVGAWILPDRTATARDMAPDWNQPGVAACIGLGALLALGGLGLALHLPLWVTAGPFAVGGIALGATRVLAIPRRRVPGLALALGALTVAALGAVAVAQAHVGLRAPLNACDELRAYLPMVNRFLDTSAIIEPWSYRRLQNLGGFTYLQAIPVGFLGNRGIGLAEILLASVFLGGLFVANGLRATFTRVVSLLFILSIPVLWIPRINVAPVLFMVPLLVAVFASTAQLRVALRSGDRAAGARWALGAGLLLAGLWSVRAPIMPVAAASLVLGVVLLGGCGWRERLRVVLVTAATGAVATVSWLVASWQAVGTPLYPLLPGNANTSVPAERNPAITTLADYAGNTLDYLRSGSYFWVVLGVLVLALLARRFLPDGALVVIVAAAALASILAFSVTISIASDRDFGRYIAPMGAGVAVFFLVETLRALDPLLLAGLDRRAARAGLLVLGAGLLGLVAVFTPIAVRPAQNTILLPGGWSVFDWSDPIPGFYRASRLETPALEAAWRRVLRRVDPDRTIAGVDRPYLVDYARDDIPNLDFPGWATPTGTFPYFAGPEAKLAYLAREGYETLVVTEPQRDQCLSPPYQHFARTIGPPDSVYAKYFLDWTDDISAVEARAPRAITRVGELTVIDVPAARRALADR